MIQATGTLKLKTGSAAETARFGRHLADRLLAGDIVCFYGDLGSGKTTMIKGIADGLKVNPESVHSPTFTLLQVYEQGRLPLYHFDLYRIERPEELGDIGYDEFLFGQGVAVVEWSEKFGPLLPAERLEIHLTHQGEEARAITMKAVGQRYRKIVSAASKFGKAS